MRYKDFKIVETKLQEAEEVYVIGDSHARAMGGSNNFAVNGARIAAIVQQAQRVPNGSFVFVSAGHNDVAAGMNPNVIAREVKALVDGLTTRKDCEVVYILFPEGTDNPNQENMGPAREAIRSIGVPIGEDLEGCSLTDGQHCSTSTYTAILNNSERSQEAQEDGLQAGPPYPQEDRDAVRSLQTKLEELGYSVGSTGIDGKYGPRTSRAVNAYKTDFNVDNTDRGRSISSEEITSMMQAQPVEEPSPTGNEGGGSARYDLPPLSDETDVQGRVGAILDFIAQYESRGQYDVRNGMSRDPRILDMTINEVLRYQNNWRSWPDSASSAIGRYQYTQGTLEWMSGLMGVNRSTQKFDEDYQDELCIYDLRYRCDLDDWLDGRLDNESFINKISEVWAAIPNSSNQSTYRGVANNRRGIDFDDAVAYIDRIRNSETG